MNTISRAVGQAAPGVEPDATMMREHLVQLFAAAFDTNCKFALGRSPGWAAEIFAASEEGVTKAVKWVMRHAHDHDLYVRPGLIRGDFDGDPSRIKDEHIVGLPAFWSDHDVEEHFARIGHQAERLGNKPAPSFWVTTGTKPNLRRQFYWSLDGLMGNIDSWRDISKGLSEFFGSDGAVSNPSSYMRLAGSIAHPKPGKPGRVLELVRLESRGLHQHEPEALRTAFPAPAAPRQEVTFDVSAAEPSAPAQGRSGDPLLALCERSKLDGEWHTSIRDLTAMLVGRGRTDAEIHAFVFAHGQADHGLGDPDVQKLIDSARGKFDHPPPTFAAEEAGSGLLNLRPKFRGDPGSIPPQEWIIDDLVGAGSLTLFAGAPGTGKSLFAQTVATAAAFGAQIGPFVASRRFNVGVFNVEDPRSRIDERQVAIEQEYDLTEGDKEVALVQSGEGDDNLQLSSPNSKGFSDLDANQLGRIKDTIREFELDLLILDPWTNIHGSQSNDERLLHDVCVQLKRIAADENCAIVLVAHTRKLPPQKADWPTMDDVAGSSAQMRTPRAVCLMVRLDAKYAESFCEENGIPKAMRSSCIAFYSVKKNYGPSGSTHILYKLARPISEKAKKVPCLVPWDKNNPKIAEACAEAEKDQAEKDFEEAARLLRELGIQAPPGDAAKAFARKLRIDAGSNEMAGIAPGDFARVSPKSGHWAGYLFPKVFGIALEEDAEDKVEKLLKLFAQPSFGCIRKAEEGDGNRKKRDVYRSCVDFYSDATATDAAEYHYAPPSSGGELN